jgi:Na+-transporting methylmalonyl-CoA/oxaloacetate decarboxylase gamma subunit
MNKKAMMDDMFDLLFTCMAAFFILLFIGLAMNGSLVKKEENTEKESMTTQQISNYVARERASLEAGSELDEQQIETDFAYVIKWGDIPDE